MTKAGCLVANLFVYTGVWSLNRSVIHGFDLSKIVSSRQKRPPTHRSFAARKQPFLDAEFERVRPNSSHPPATKEIPKVAKVKAESKSLIDLSLEADSDFNNTRFPFIDSRSGRYIDVKLAFMAECDGVSYGIGIPFDHAAAITLENSDGSVQYVSPDDDDNEEVMQIFAAQLQSQVGENLQLKRTPRVLTIAGPLEECTNNWMEGIMPKPVSAQELWEETDEDVDFFHEFMKEELGEDVYQSVLDDKTDDLTDEIKSLFNIPGLGDQADDLEGMRELVDSMRDDPEAQTKPLSEIGESLDHDGVALRLVSYLFLGGREYSLVHMLKPYVLMARCVRTDDDIQFDLLTPDEERIVGPRIETLCKDDLEKLSASKKLL